jgi:DNA-directed RNA polymerase subunit RPC12/RpoP
MLSIDPSLDVCVTCHSLVKPERVAKGPAWIGWVLLPFYLLPGILYFAWRARTKHMACPRCGGETLVPATSTRGTEIMALANAAIPESTARLEICPSCMLPVSFPLGRNTISCPHCTTKLTLTAPGRIETD